MNSGNRTEENGAGQDTGVKPAGDKQERAGDAATRQVTEGPQPEDDAAKGEGAAKP